MADPMNTEQHIELLARILSTESSQPIIETQWKEVRDLVSALEELMDEEGPFRKREIVNRLLEKVGVTDTLLKEPGTIGKTRIGLLYDSSRARTELYTELFKTYKFQPILLKNNDIPIIHQHNTEDHFTLLNKHHHREKLTGEELYTLIREFVYTRQMDLKDSIQHISIESLLPYEYLSFTDLNVTGGNERCKEIIHNTDFVLVNLTYTKKWQSILQYLHEIHYAGRVIIVVKNKREELYQFIRGLNLEVTLLKDPDFEKTNQLLLVWDKPIDNLNISESIEESLLELVVGMKQRLTHSHETMESINKALLFNEQNEHHSLHELRDSYQEKINKQKTLVEILVKTKDTLIEKIRLIENFLREEFIVKRKLGIDPKGFVHKHQMEGTYRLTDLLIRNGEYERAKQLIEKLLTHQYHKAHILLIALQRKKGLTPIKFSLDKISSLPNNDEKIIEAKIELKDVLGLNHSQVLGLSSKLKKSHNPQALYYKGLSVERMDMKEAVSLLKKSFQLGYKEAGDHLLKQWEKTGQLNDENLTFLGDLLHPEANYLLGNKIQFKKNLDSVATVNSPSDNLLYTLYGIKEKEKVFRFSLASAAGHMKASSDLVNFYMINEQYEKAIDVCSFAIEEFGPSITIQQMLGLAFFKSEQFAKAFDTLQDIPTGQGAFLTGLMYEKGLGKVVNLPKALEYYKSGKDRGSSEAHTHYIKLSTRLEEEKKAKEKSRNKSYSNNRTYNSSTSYSSKSSSCFLTTATCKAMGKEDNCEEILSFKSFRDSWLIQQSDGAGIIKEYYKIAPLIVEQIESSSAPFEVYTKIWNEYIQKGYEYLKLEEFKKAKDLYIEMVLGLEREYIRGR